MSKNLKIIFSFVILFIGIFIFSSEYFKSKKIEVYDYMNELYYNQVVSLDDEVIEDNENNEDESVEEDTSYKFNEVIDNSIYIGYLRIPNIGFKKGFTTKESKYNTVSRNIQILNSSDYPDKELGNVIIAGHSGNSSVSYFNKLYMLNVGDLVYIDYNNVTYTYKIVDIYNVEKTGKAEIKRNKNASILTLITCTKDVKTSQTIYISELINKE